MADEPYDAGGLAIPPAAFDRMVYTPTPGEYLYHADGRVTRYLDGTWTPTPHRWHDGELPADREDPPPC